MPRALRATVRLGNGAETLDEWIEAMSLPTGVPGHMQAGPALAQRWATINPAHAIQRAAAVFTFPEELPSFVVNRTTDAVRQVARSYGMLKEEPVSSMIVQIGPGGASSTTPTNQEGTSFQDIRAGQIALNLSVTRQSIRLETGLYTRWIAFRDQLAAILTKALPVLSQSTGMQSVGLEYVDFFYAVSEGPEDVGLVLDNKSDLVAKRAFRKRSPFHTHSGWFTDDTVNGRNLINVDLNVADGQGPIGVRRTISVRTFEAEQVRDINGLRAMELMALEPVLRTIDGLHVSLKERLGHVLTRDAKTMISLGS